MVGPAFTHAASPQNEIGAINLPQDVQLTVTLQPSVNDLSENYFTVYASMNMGILENSTIQLDYGIIVLPGPVISLSGTIGTFVPFSNLNHEGVSSSFYPNGTVLRFEEYSYDVNLSSTYVSREPILFPADYYSSSFIYIWFNAPFYPDVAISPASSLPQGCVAYLSAPEFITPKDFYFNIISPLMRLGMGMPSNNVMAFQIVV
jgi:hypothetical protein